MQSVSNKMKKTHVNFLKQNTTTEVCKRSSDSDTDVCIPEISVKDACFLFSRTRQRMHAVLSNKMKKAAVNEYNCLFLFMKNQDLGYSQQGLAKLQTFNSVTGP